jgi:TrmH family RNA methyltransferase
VQRLRLLATRRSARWEAGRFVAEGPKLLDEALAAGVTIEAVYLDAGAATEEHRDLAERARRVGADAAEVQPGVLARVSDTVTPQPLTAIVAMGVMDLEALPLDGLTVVGVGIQDPGNAGTVIRSAWASGSGAVVFCAGAVDIYNPKTVRASAGAVFHLPLVAGPEPDAVLDLLGSRGVARIGSVVRGGQDHDRIDWTGDSALILGSESHGLPVALAERLDGQVTIPMHRGAESLNVAMAATVVCFEAARQRRVAARGAP